MRVGFSPEVLKFHERGLKVMWFPCLLPDLEQEGGGVYLSYFSGEGWWPDPPEIMVLNYHARSGGGDIEL